MGRRHAPRAIQTWFDFHEAGSQLVAMVDFGTCGFSGPCSRHGSGRMMRPALLGLLPVLLMPDPCGGKRG